MSTNFNQSERLVSSLNLISYNSLVFVFTIWHGNVLGSFGFGRIKIPSISGMTPFNKEKLVLLKFIRFF